jgi:AsmA protein
MTRPRPNAEVEHLIHSRGITVKKHPLISILVGVVILLLLAVLLVPLFVNVNTFRSTLETQLSSALGRKVTLGNLSFSIFSGSLVADNVSIADDPAFSDKPFLQAQSLHIGVEVMPLLLHRQLLVRNFVADSPSINLVHNAQGVWNFSDIGTHAASRTQDTQKETALPNFTVGELKVVNGTAAVSDLPATGAPFVYSNLNLSVEQFSFAKAFPFELTASLPAGGTLEVKGNAGPVNQKDASETPLGANIDLKHFDPVAAGVLPKSNGVSMLADITAQVTSNGQILNSNGTVHAANLVLVANGSPTPSPVDLKYTIQHNLEARSGEISDLTVNTGAVAAHVTGTYQIKGPQTILALHLSAPNLPIDQVEALLPAAGVRLPSGSKLQGGTLTANLNITGPSSGPTISGPVEVDNTKLAGFDLSSKIGGLKPVSNSQGGTVIQTVRANVASSSEGTRIDNLYTSVPSLGTATGSGTVAPGGGLNFQVVAKINTTSGVGAQALAGANAANGILGQAISTAAANGIPVHISGTTSNPVIQADLSKLFEKNAGNILKQQILGNGNQKPNPGALLNNLFHH